MTLLLGLGLGLSGQAAEKGVARALRTDGPVYFIGKLTPLYEHEEPGYPPLDGLDDDEFTLGRTVDGYVAPRPGVRTIHFRLHHLMQAPTQRIYASGLRHLNEQIVSWLNKRGLFGVTVQPHPDDIEPGTNRDLRSRDETALRLLIRVEKPRPEKDSTPSDTDSRSDSGAMPFNIHVLESDGAAYPIDQISPLYAEDHSGHPLLSGLRRAGFLLGRTADGYVAPRPGIQHVRFRLGQLDAAPVQTIYASAIRALDEQIVAWLNARGLVGVFVRPHEEDIDPASGEDLRKSNEHDLRLLIWTGRVHEIRTFASGTRVAPEDRVDNATHEAIKQHSPIKPGALRGHDLVRKDQLDAYVARLNRHPGRRVDVALSPGREPGSVDLDYLVAENKPWTLYADWSNTGTRQTTRSRQRFGFTHTQLTGKDDILSLDYVTGDFNEVHAVNGSYDTPLFGSESVRGNLQADYSEYDASVIGFPDKSFKGDRFGFGGELVANLFQQDQLFVDLLGGVRYQTIHVDNPFATQDARDDFVLPHIGLRIERKTETSSLRTDVQIEVNNSRLSRNRASDSAASAGLGRTNPDADWRVLRWSHTFSTYLEPLLDPVAWSDPSTPASSTLAHELAFVFRGQYAFGNRLIPQEQAIAGGFRSVRGYRQAAAVGDSVFIGSAEYRFHVPRLLAPRSSTARVPLFGDFRIAPTQVYGLPDWDLVLRTFLDGARVEKSDRSASEQNESLLSAGVGAELQLWRNFIGRIDLGIALLDDASLDTDRGDTEVHFSLTTLY